MTFATTHSTSPSIHAQMKLSRLMEMPEREFEARVRNLEEQELFRRLRSLGVISQHSYANARFGVPRMSGFELRSSGASLSDALDGNGELVSLIRRVGQERFEECFLRGDELSSEERAEQCGISIEETRQLTEMIDRLYVQAEFETTAADVSSEPSFSMVAGIELEAKRPVLSFFNRELWQGRYRVDESRRAEVFAALDRKDATSAARVLAELEFLELRKSTLYKVLETLIDAQASFLNAGDPIRRVPLTQRAVAARVGIEPSTLNRLISNKSVQLPWGLQAPLKVFMPSAKLLARDQLYDIAVALPEASDSTLSAEMSRVHGLRLSRRSIAQYRKELGLQGSGWRGLPLGATPPVRPAVAAGAFA